MMEIGEAMAAEEATLAEPLSCAVNGLRVSRVELGDVVVVFGAGPMGLLNMMCANISGAFGGGRGGCESGAPRECERIGSELDG